MKLSDFSNKPPKKYATSVYVFMWYSTYFFPTDSESNIFDNYLVFPVTFITFFKILNTTYQHCCKKRQIFKIPGLSFD